MFAGNPHALSMSEFHDPKAVKPRQSLASFINAIIEPRIDNLIINTLNNNKYNMIE